MAQIGTHGKQNTADSRAWARVAPVVKVTIDLALFREITDDRVVRVARRIFNTGEQDRFIDNMDAVGLSNAILEFLAGYRHPNLYVELLNEIGKGRNAAYVQLAKLVVPRLQTAGVKVLVPSWGTGDFEWQQWLEWRRENWAGANGIALHGYWGLPKGTPPEKLFTKWNALRYRTYHDVAAGDPKLLIVTEFGRDKNVRDGPNNSTVGNGGYVADGLSAEEFSIECLNIDKEYAKDKVLGCGFTNGPDVGGIWDDYNMDPVVPYLIPHAGPAQLPDLGVTQVNPGEVERYASDIYKRYGIPFNANSALAKYFLQELKAGKFLGFPMEPEHNSENSKYIIQGFSNTIIYYDKATGAVKEGLPPL